MYLRWYQSHEDAQVRPTVHPARRPGPTGEELLRTAASLPPAQARDLLGRARIALSEPSAAIRQPADPGPPAYLSWEDFLAQVKATEVMAWCRAKAKQASGPRLMSAKPDAQITAKDVWAIMATARGTCSYCGSLAVEKRPSTPTGQPLPWEHVGRRIGSLSHVVSRFDGGTNTTGNLCWSCLWCNTYRSEGRLGATDHGGLQPEGDLCGIPGCGVVRPKDADLSLQPDLCPEHGGELGELCATCLGVMRKVRAEHCLDTRTGLQEAYRQQHNRCPGSEPLAVLPTLNEVHGCRAVVTAPVGDKGFRARHDALKAGLPGNFTDQQWVEETRHAAEVAGLAIDEYVLKTAQAPHQCDRCEAQAVLVPESVTRITDELARLRRVHGRLHRISFDPLSIDPWQAKALGPRRQLLEADSPGGLRLRIGDAKRAAAWRASKKPS